MKISFKSKLLAALLGMALVAVNAIGADFIIDRDKVEVVPAPPEAKFTVRLTEIDAVTKVQATVGGKEAPATFKAANEGKTLVYFLLDVSEQNGAGFVKEESEAVRDMADNLLADEKAQTLFQVGIGTIGSKHKNFAYSLPTKDVRAATLEKVTKEKPDATAEIYRCALEAIEQFKVQQGGERKVLFILSSGRSTDTDKNRNSAEALIAAANKEAIPVFVIGFSKTQAGMSAWQELRSVAKETGGGFIETITSANSRPGSPNAELFGRLKASAVVSVDLKGTAAGKQPLVVNFDLNSGKKLKIVEREIDVPSSSVVPPADPATQTTPATQAQTPPLSGTQPTPAATPSKMTDQPWFLPAVVGGGLLVLGLLAFLIYKAQRTTGGDCVSGPETDRMLELEAAKWRNRSGESGGSGDTIPDTLRESEVLDEGPTRLVIGWLEEFDKSDQPVARHEITRGNFTIGRSSDSSLRFLDDSVSVHHANIHRRSDRSLEITDLRSANKTRVNGKPVEHCVLKDGDKIELGDIRLKLVLNSSES